MVDAIKKLKDGLLLAADAVAPLVDDSKVKADYNLWLKQNLIVFGFQRRFLIGFRRMFLHFSNFVLGCSTRVKSFAYLKRPPLRKPSRPRYCSFSNFEIRSQTIVKTKIIFYVLKLYQNN